MLGVLVAGALVTFGVILALLAGRAAGVAVAGVSFVLTLGLAVAFVSAALRARRPR
jgi:hypothetical protein